MKKYSVPTEMKSSGKIRGGGEVWHPRGWKPSSLPSNQKHLSRKLDARWQSDIQENAAGVSSRPPRVFFTKHFTTVLLFSSSRNKIPTVLGGHLLRNLDFKRWFRGRCLHQGNIHDPPYASAVSKMLVKCYRYWWLLVPFYRDTRSEKYTPIYLT